MNKILLITHYLAPYRNYTINYLTKLFNNKIEVISLWDTDKKHHYWKYKNKNINTRVLKNKISFSRMNRIFDFHFEIFCYVFNPQYKLVFVPGFIPFTSLIAIILMYLMRKKYIICIDTVRLNKNNRVIHYFKNKIFLKAAGFWVPGIATKNYLIKYFQIIDKNIFTGIYHYNSEEVLDQFYSEIINHTANISRNDNDIVFLMVANFYPSRNYQLLLKLIKQAKEEDLKCSFIIIGSGPELESMQKYAHLNSLTNCNIIQNVSFKSLGDFYRKADVYIHTGNEPYSTSLAIAAICCLPIISSLDVGASHDYLIDGINGYLIKDSTSVKEWYSNILNILRLPKEKLEEMGNNSYKIATSRDKLIKEEINLLLGCIERIYES